jgi:quercetin dioxygenase-like cupin family protein
MAITFNENTVAPRTIGPNIQCQPLLNDSRVPGIKFSVERIAFGASATLQVRIPSADLAWFQVLHGEVELAHSSMSEPLSQANMVFLPPGFQGVLHGREGVAVLLAKIPEAKRIDPGFDPGALSLRVVDWTREPVLQSQHDARKRIYLVTPKLFNTKAIKGEMIIYPPGTEAANHHHEGAAHFMYILEGAATAYANEQPFPVRKGDIVYYPDGERHFMRSNSDSEMRFAEFFIPGSYKTVWAKDANVCTWIPSGRSIRGEKAAREIQAHSSAAPTADI